MDVLRRWNYCRPRVYSLVDRDEEEAERLDETTVYETLLSPRLLDGYCQCDGCEYDLMQTVVVNEEVGRALGRGCEP